MRDLLRALRCRFTGGHRWLTHHDIDTGFVYSVQCVRCYTTRPGD